MQKENGTNVLRVRFAPSPTGHLHVGGARVAIFNWLLARNLGGKYLLRIEDTDVLRSKQEYTDSLLNAFEWLELMPDEPAVYQLSRLPEHHKAAKSLVEKGFAYYCFCEPKERTEFLQEESGYSGVCRDKNFSPEDLKNPHAIRFKLPKRSGNVEFNDIIRGPISIGYDQLDDFIIVRRDGIPVYNFVVVIDDIFMKISHVIRGEDHISNTPKQILLYEALGAELPQFAHLPLILGKSGQRLSKRDAAVSVQEYKEMGILPQALFNYLVRLGWSHGDQEIFSKNEMIAHFGLEAVGKKGSIFDIKKLEWLNGVYMRNMSAQELIESTKNIGALHGALTFSWPKEKLERLIILYRDRATKLTDLANEIISLAKGTDEFDTSLIAKWQSPNTKLILKDFAQNLKESVNPDFNKMHDVAQKVCANYSAPLVELAQALRLAIVGKVASPGIFEIMEVVGKEESLRRVNLLLTAL